MTRAGIVALGSLLLAGCAPMTSSNTPGHAASADLRNAAGQSVGHATLTTVGSEVRIVLDLRGLPPGVKGSTANIGARVACGVIVPAPSATGELPVSTRG